jgi:hypothetical protein
MHKSLIRRKIFSVQHRINRKIYGNRLNLPYLSGDGFESICDYSAFSPRVNLISNSDISLAKSIFCNSEKLEQLIQDLGGEIKAQTLVLGNSDRDFYDFNFELPKSIKEVYLQNSHISNDFYKLLPIGLENLRFARNGIPTLFGSKYYQRQKKYKVIAGPFSPTHSERNEILKWRDITHDSLIYIEGYISPVRFAEFTSQNLFVACPRGNGTDTHRFWETLYRGSIPVVKKSNWSESVAELKVPLIQLTSWDFEEFFSIVSQHRFEPVNPESIPVLKIEHWRDLFQS